MLFSETAKKNDGCLLVTTPNVLGSESLMQLLKRRELLYFSTEWYKSLGHITILPDWLLDIHLKNNGFTEVFKGFFSRLLKRNISMSPKKILGYLALKILDIMALILGRSKAETTGTNYICTGKKR